MYFVLKVKHKFHSIHVSKNIILVHFIRKSEIENIKKLNKCRAMEDLIKSQG